MMRHSDKEKVYCSTHNTQLADLTLLFARVKAGPRSLSITD